MMLVFGEAGVGKTALVRQFVETQPRARVLIGTCEPLDTPEALAPLFDIAADLGPDIQSRLAGEPRRAELFAAVVACLETSKRPWLLVVEDVHWADQATLDLLRYLGRRIDRLHGMIIATYRDEDTTATPLAIVLGDLATSSGVQRLPLEPLSEAATGELAVGAGIDPHELFERTAGNPFFITEVLAAATERLPTSVRDAVLARVARAPAVTRRTLEIAAALGRRFEAELLAAVLDRVGIPRWTMRDAVFRGLLRWEGAMLAFRHAIAQAAIHDSIPPDQLQSLHRAILGELERSDGGPDLYASMVVHADAAGDDMAVLRYAPMGAARAAKLSAHRESARLYAKALACARAAPVATRAELAEQQAEQLYHSAELSLAIARFKEAADLWRSSGKDIGLGRVLTRIAAISFVIGRYRDAEHAEQEALNRLEGQKLSRELVMAHENRSRRLFMELDPLGSERSGQVALGVAREIGDADAVLSARVCVGAARLLAADESARSELVECHLQATQRDLPDLAARSALYLGWLPQLFHNYVDVEHFLTAGQAYAAEHELEYWRLLALGARVRYCLDQGRWREAERQTRWRRRSSIIQRRSHWLA
jgi:hypothetical protein